MKILLTTNSFKNSLSAVKVSEILSSELSKINGLDIFQCPISDGGDGFLDVIEFHSKELLKKFYYKIRFAETSFECPVLFSESNKTLYIESAEAIGIKKINSTDLQPLFYNSSSLGELINKILIDSEKGEFPFFEKIIIGIGGTATIDFGLGVLEKLGFRFLDQSDNQLFPIPINFSKIRNIIPANHKSDKIIQCVVDVQTKLFGKKNAVDIYGLQKGASPGDLMIIKNGIKNIIEVFNNTFFHIDEHTLNGAGGGLASGLNIFLNAEIISSIDFILNNLMEKILNNNYDYVITTEGRFDNQSFEGKATGEIIKLFSTRAKNIFLVCGYAEKNMQDILPQNVHIIELKNYFNSIEQSINNPGAGLKISAEKIIELIKFRTHLELK